MGRENRSAGHDTDAKRRPRLGSKHSSYECAFRELVSNYRSARSSAFATVQAAPLGVPSKRFEERDVQRPTLRPNGIVDPAMHASSLSRRRSPPPTAYFRVERPKRSSRGATLPALANRAPLNRHTSGKRYAPCARPSTLSRYRPSRYPRIRSAPPSSGSSWNGVAPETASANPFTART